MNKVQMIELLRFRGITELNKGESVADAIARSGGEPTLQEMVIANENAMKYFIGKFQVEENLTKHLALSLESANLRIEKLEEDNLFLQCLREAGVDNWSGYSYAQELKDEYDRSEE